MCGTFAPNNAGSLVFGTFVKLTPIVRPGWTDTETKAAHHKNKDNMKITTNNRAGKKIGDKTRSSSAETCRTCELWLLLGSGYLLDLIRYILGTSY